MKVCVIVSVLIIQVITCEKTDTQLRRKLIAPKMNEQCKNTKCPSVKDPQCVRLRRHDLGLTFHMIVANKCELEYLKCHDAVEGKIVPLKFCGPYAVLTADKHKNEQGKDQKMSRKRRRKILLLDHKRMQPKHDTRNHTQMLRRNGTRGHGRMQRKNQIQKDVGKHARLSLGYYFSSETNSDIENNEKKKLEKGIGGYRINMYDEQYSQLEPKSFSLPKGFKPAVFHKADKRWVRPSFPMFSMETVNNYDKNEEQYVAACPTVCPTRDVMVCGKSQHGIYRTYSSDCHMRMYGCIHPEENVQLVSRVPCVQSSPFLSEPGLQPQGRIGRPQDDDVVLRYIRCRDKGLIELLKTLVAETTQNPLLADYTNYYKYHKTEKSWDESKETCELENATLYYPENKVEYDAVLKFINKQNEGSVKHWTWVYLGIKGFNDFYTFEDQKYKQNLYDRRENRTDCNEGENITDRNTYHKDGGPFLVPYPGDRGKPISEVYIKWRPGQPDNHGGIEDCVHMNLLGLYNDVECSRVYAFICKKNVSTSVTIEQHVPTIENPFMAEYTYLEEVNYYYKYHRTAKTWDESKETCETEGGTLYYPENKAEYDVVLEFFNNYEEESNKDWTWVYLGLRRIKEFQTSDDKPISKLYIPPDSRGLEGCVRMNLDGLYRDIVCSSEYAFICKKKEKNEDTLISVTTEQLQRGYDPRCKFEPTKETL